MQSRPRRNEDTAQETAGRQRIYVVEVIVVAAKAARFVRAASRRSGLGPGGDRFRQQAFALGAFAGQFPRTAD